MSGVQVEVGANTRQAQKQIQDFAKSSRIALTNLSLVIQDLPFGFIGIQNNLPFVVKSFQDLRKEVGGTKNALSTLLDSVTGPAGLFFTFSAVTTVLTVLTQQYGSLSNAANILLGIQKSQKEILNQLNVEIEKANSNTAGEIENAKSLFNILTSQIYTQEQKLGEYRELNKQYPALLNGLSEEKVLNGQLNTELDKRINLITTQIRLEGQREAIIGLLSEATKNYLKALRTLGEEDFLTGLGNTIRGLISGDLNPFTQRLTGAVGAIGSAAKETEYWRNVLNQVNLELTKTNGEIDKFGKKDIAQAFKGKVDRTQGLAPIIPFIFPSESDFIKNFKARAKRFAKLQRDLIERAQLVVTDVGGPGQNNLRSPLLPDEKDIKLFEDYYKQINQIIQDKTQSIAASIRIGIRQPLMEIFDMLLTKGKFSWEFFGNAVIDVLKRIAVQLTATAIAGAIANILAPGAGIAVGGLLKGISTFALGDYLGDFGGSANLSGISSGMGMSGQVVFVQRGTDLVGVLNRTNTNINRIG